MAKVLRACADETRLRLLNLLSGGDEVCVCHLVEALGTSQPKVSRHLAYLRRAGLVRDRKDGLWVHYRLSESLDEATERVLGALRMACAAGQSDDVARLAEARQSQPILRLTSRAAPLAPEPPPPPQDLDVELL